MAAQENHIEVVKYLLENGANQSTATEVRYIVLFLHTLLFNFAFIFRSLDVRRFFRRSILRTFTLSFQQVIFMNLTLFFYTHSRQGWTVLEAVKSQGMKSSLIRLTAKLALTLVSPGFSPSVCAHFSYQLPGELSEKRTRLWREVPRAVEIGGGQGGIVRGMEWIVERSQAKQRGTTFSFEQIYVSDKAHENPSI